MDIHLKIELIFEIVSTYVRGGGKKIGCSIQFLDA